MAQEKKKVELTKNEIAALKKKYKVDAIHKIVIEKNGEKQTAYLKDPNGDITLLGAAMEKEKKMDQAIFFLDNLLIKDKSDKSYQTDNQVRIAAAFEAKSLVDLLEADTVKL